MMRCARVAPPPEHTAEGIGAAALALLALGGLGVLLKRKRGIGGLVGPAPRRGIRLACVPRLEVADRAKPGDGPCGHALLRLSSEYASLKGAGMDDPLGSRDRPEGFGRLHRGRRCGTQTSPCLRRSLPSPDSQILRVRFAGSSRLWE